MNRRITFLVRICLLCLGLLLTASSCNPPLPEQPPDVIVPETTKVADEETREALESFELDSGVLRFTSTTPALQDLEVGDVVVSSPSEAAPYGYLRKVTAIRQESGEVIVETAQASLTEAIHEGSFQAEGKLTPSDLAEARPLIEGVTLRTLDSRAGGLQTADVKGDGYDFEAAIDVTIDGNIGGGGVSGKGKVRIQGVLRFNAGYDIGYGVEACWEIPPVCVDRFEARLGIEQYSNLKVTGELEGQLEREVELATYYFEPIVFWIGPVPVVLVPVIDAVVGANGEAKLNFSFEAEESVQLLLGAKWTDPDDGGRGWEDLSRNNGVQGRAIDQNLDASMKLRAYGKADAKLLFYGVAGPGFATRVGAGADVQYPRKPLWKIFGYLGASFNFQVDIAGILKLAEYSKDVLDEEFTLLEASNQPPRFSNVVTSMISVEVGTPVNLGPRAGFGGYFDVSDPEGDPLTLSASSNVDGAIPLNVTFTSVGPRSVTVTARDSEGASASITLSLNASSSPPFLSTSVDSTTVPATIQYRIGAVALDSSGNELSCGQLSWSVTAPDTVTDLGSALSGGCEAVAVFANPGTRTVIVTATNQYGSSISETVTVTVTDAPVNHAPIIDPYSFSVRASTGPKSDACITGFWCEVPEGAVLYNGQIGDYYPPLELSVSASDPEGDALSYTWSCTADDYAAPIIANADGTFTCDTTAFPGNRTVIVRVEVDDGTTTVSWHRSFITLMYVN